MKKTLLTAVACLFISAPAFAMTDADCTAMWKQADTDADGKLNETEGGRYSAWMRLAEKPMADGTMMDEAMFQENCKADVFASATVDEGAPLEGANSFTEGQASDRIVAAGLMTPSGLAKDDKGIWRGTAMKEGKSVNVAVDYKGNVVAN
jgi:hypothetical protein